MTKVKSNSTITCVQMDGKLEFTVLGAGKFVFDPDKVSAVNRARAMIHGFRQRISDGGALSRNPETGKPATPADKMAKMQRISDHLMSGSDVWEMAAGTPGMDAGLILQAIMRVFSKTLEQAEALIAATMEKREIERTPALKVWAESKQVAAAMLAIKSERLAVGTKDDAEDLLAEIEGDGGDEGGEDEESDET